MEWLSSPHSWMALVTLTALEVVLGIDNIIFISILTGKLPSSEQPKARNLGLFLAMFMRIGLLFSLTWVMRLTNPLFAIWQHEFAGRDLILIAGGLFLIAKSTSEIHEKLEGHEQSTRSMARSAFAGVIIQIMLLDIVFSLDSVITAIGMSNQLPIMVSAVVIAVVFMQFCAGAVSDFVHRHPTIKILALSFLLLIGVMLVADGFGQHISKGYIYFAMAFSVFVEMLNLRIRGKEREPLKLHEPFLKRNQRNPSG